ncbi:hypothetical protein FI667_g6642, partial [Globisporangium splendens]
MPHFAQDMLANEQIAAVDENGSALTTMRYVAADVQIGTVRGACRSKKHHVWTPFSHWNYRQSVALVPRRSAAFDAYTRLISSSRTLPTTAMSSPHGVSHLSSESERRVVSALHHAAHSSDPRTSRQTLHAPTLQSDTVVFQHAKLPSRQQGANGSSAAVAAARTNGSRTDSLPMPRADASSAAYSNAWPSSSGAPPAMKQQSAGYRDYRDEHEEQRMPPSTADGRYFYRNGGDREKSQHPSYSNVPPRNGSPSVPHRVSSTDSPQSQAMGARHTGVAGVNSYVNGEDRGAERGGHGTSFTHLLQDAVASTSPTSRSGASQQQRGAENAHQAAGNGTGATHPDARRNINESVLRMTIRVMKEGNKLGFGIRHDSQRKLRVSTLQGNSAASKSSLRLGDILLSVNGINLNDLGFLEVIQHLKATKPGELVFDIERDMNASPDHKYEFAPNDMLDGGGGDEFLGEAASYVIANGGRLGGTTGVPAPPRQLSPHSAAIGSSRSSMDMSSSVGIPPTVEPQRKRARPSTGGIEGGVNGADAASKMEKTHKQVVNTLVLELKKEKAEKVHLEDKNNALRKRLQKMLIECDEVRVKASTEVAAVKEKARHEVQELEKALVAARAQLRLNDRGPNVSRTDSIVKDLVGCKAQLDRMKRIDAERTTQLTARYNMESRQAEREAHRVREKLIVEFQQKFRQVAKRGLTNGGGGGGGGKVDNAQTVTVLYEGIRRLAFLKLFGLAHDYDHYASSEYQSLTQIHRVLEHDEVADLFGNALSHEERTGFFIVAVAPMDVVYDPSTERLNLVCQWGEQNTIRELARNFRF